MTDTRVLLNRIAALRQRMEQVHPRADTPPAAESQAAGQQPERVRRLENQVSTGNQHGALLDSSFRQLDGHGATDGPTLPRQLTARARRLLLVGQGLLDQLRGLAEPFGGELRPSTVEPLPELGSWPGIGSFDPLAARYRETVAMLDTALRTVQAYPDSPSVQLRLCDGLEAVLGVVGDRNAGLQAAVDRRRSEALRIDRLAELLLNLADGQPVEVASFVHLAETLLNDAMQGYPLRFLYVEPLPDLGHVRARTWQARAVACHSLTVAQVVAKLVRHEPDLRSQPLEPVLAALVHDVGMLRVPVAVYAQTTPLEEEQRRVVESHTRIGAELVARLWPSAGWLADAACSHHERHDGTGYPAGLREVQIAPLVRFLAVCDVYAAWCTPRPHRPAHEPRTALTDTLLLAEKGVLDRTFAERLLHLSFYPAGSVVELADGALAVVVATPVAWHDLTMPSRPVVALLTNAQGQWLPSPRHVNLAECEDRTIVRTLMAAERRRVLGKHYPEMV